MALVQGVIDSPIVSARAVETERGPSAIHSAQVVAIETQAVVVAEIGVQVVGTITQADGPMTGRAGSGRVSRSILES